MKNLRFIAMTGFIACCMLLLGSQSSTFAQEKVEKAEVIPTLENHVLLMLFDAESSV